MGTVVLSIDAELAWGFHDQRRLPTGRLENARGAWQNTIELLDRYDVPATWAVVGHLMLDACDGEHPDHPTPVGWFDRDPGGTAADAGLWMAPELVRRILDADVAHEIASHTFSHLDLSAPDVTDRMVDAELRRHKTLAEDWGLELQTLVFPHNRIARRPQLADAGFRCYRGTPLGRWYEGSAFRRSKKALDLLLGPADPPVVRPSRDEHGLVDIPASLHLFGFEGTPGGVARSLGKDPILAAAEEGIAAAERGEGVFHAWFHPNNMTTQAHYERLADILAIVHEHDVSVRTMGELAETVRPRPYA